jgi:hypothetical protein
MLTLATGNLAYFDSFAGMVPCWIVAINGPSGAPSTAQSVTIKFTAKRGPYKRGETYTTSGLHVCPRGAARFGKHCTTIRPFEFVAV